MNTSNLQKVALGRDGSTLKFAKLASSIALFVGLFLFTTTAYAAEFTAPTYDVYRGDVDSDGHEDLFLRSTRFLFISGKVSVPLTLSGPHSYLLSGQSDGFFSAPVEDNSVDHKLLTRQSAGVSFADFDDDGESDIVIQGENIGDQSVLLTGNNSDPAILQQFSMINGRDVSLESGIISMRDLDDDGHADFTITWAIGPPSVLINLGTGSFEFSGQSQTTYIHTDFLGSTVAESDFAGTVTQRYYFRPYGASIGTGSENEPAYTGHVFDGDLGLSYMQQRYYDPVLGRFYSDDPVGFQLDQPHSFNRYAYAWNNPYAYIDPDGRFVFAFFAGLIADTAAATVAYVATVVVALTAAVVGTDAAIDAVNAMADGKDDASGGDTTGSNDDSDTTSDAEPESSPEPDAEAQRNPRDDKLVTKGEIKKMIKGGAHPHDFKDNSKQDLFKDKKGNVYVKPKSGQGPGDPTGLNINDF